MKLRKGTAFLSLTIASGAALVASAATASAAPATYASTSSATAGSLNVGDGPAGPANTSTATDAHPSAGTMSGINHKDLPNGLGTIAATHDLDLLTTHAQVYSNGVSTACSAAFSGACGQRPAPLDLRLNLKKVLTVANSGVGNWTDLSIVANSLPDPLNDYTIVLGITGPAATCTAGPAGGPGSTFKISRSIGSGTVDLLDKGKSVIGGPRAIGTNGDALEPLAKYGNGALSFANIPGVSISVSFTPGTDSGAGKGPAASAEVGSLSVSINTFKAVTLTGGKVSCGPNQQTAAVTSASSSSGGTGGSTGLQAGSTGTAPATTDTSTSSEIPVKQIQTDEGSSAGQPFGLAGSLVAKP